MYRIIFFLLVTSEIYLCKNLSKKYVVEKYKDNLAVKRLQQYIQINTSTLENAETVADFWRRQADELRLDFAIYRPAELPIVVITLKGKRPDLPSIMLNSHADVVPTDDEFWTYPPYSGYINENGNMYGRGTQDTKGTGVQYLEAVRRLIQNNITLDRTLHLTVMPDEESGGLRGMVPFVETKEFISMNIGFAFDEGMTTSDNIFYALYQDKRPWQVKFTIRGKGGHGSSTTDNSAVEGVQKLINVAMSYRNKQINIMRTVEKFDFGAYTTLNINMIEGGIAPNVIPVTISVVMDLRLSVNTRVEDVQGMLDTWLSELGSESSIEFIRRVEHSPVTATDDSNIYWIAIRETLEELGKKVVPIVCPATTDMVPIRAKGIPAFGFSTRNTAVNRMHDVDEYIPVDNFLNGIDIYVALLERLGNLQ